MSMETTAEHQQRLPPPYHHHHNQRRHGRYRSINLAGTQRGPIDCSRIPAIEKYAYCLCLHVKPTTIFIAALKLIDAFLFISILLNTEFQIDERPYSDLGFNGGDGGHRSTAVAVGIMTRIIIASAAAVAIYAVMSGRAALLMPLYSVLLIDFFFALPSFYGRDMDTFASDGVIGIKNYSNPSNNDLYSRYSVFLSTLAMVVKIYFLCVIWKCYRYLRLIQLVGEVCSQMPNPIVRVLRLEDGSPDSSNPNQSAAPPPYESIASSLKPPNYEDAIKSSNIYTINIQPQNSHLPNYSNAIQLQEGSAASATSTQLLPISEPFTPTENDDAVGNTVASGDDATNLSTLHGQREGLKTSKIDGQFIDLNLDQDQSPQTVDIMHSETSTTFDDKIGGNALNPR